MKHILTLIVIFIICCSSAAQTREDYKMIDSSSVHTVYKRILENSFALNGIEERLIRLERIVSPQYKLYPTQNKWTFLELDTMFGVVYHIQWSIEENYLRYRLGYVNDIKEPSENYYSGRFEMYPTTNVYNFLVLDTRTGDVFQVQWNTERKNEGIWKIE